MSDSVMARLTGWSPAQLAAWRSALRQPAGLYYRVDRLRAVLPAEMLDDKTAQIESTDPVPVGDQLSVTFDQLPLAEQHEWRVLQADKALSPEQRCKGMRASKIAERGYMARLCDAATARAQGREQGRLFTDADLDECIPERLKLPAH